MEFIESLFGIALTVHVSAVFITLAVVLSSDVYAALWVFGKKEVLNKRGIKWFHDVVWIGLGIIMTSGIILFLPFKEYLLSDFAFRIKILFVVFLVMNAFVIGKHMHIAYTRSFASLRWGERIPLLISGAVSITGWLGAFIAAQFINL